MWYSRAENRNGYCSSCPNVACLLFAAKSAEESGDSGYMHQPIGTRVP